MCRMRSPLCSLPTEHTRASVLQTVISSVDFRSRMARDEVGDQARTVPGALSGLIISDQPHPAHFDSRFDSPPFLPALCESSRDARTAVVARASLSPPPTRVPSPQVPLSFIRLAQLPGTMQSEHRAPGVLVSGARSRSLGLWGSSGHQIRALYQDRGRGGWSDMLARS